jgi:hypothetical protein
MDTEAEIDPDALAAYHIVLASLKHPAVHQNEAMHLLTRGQIEWVTTALMLHGTVQVQWDTSHAWVELRAHGRIVSLYFPVEQSRRESARAAVPVRGDEDEDGDDFKRERIR